MKTNYQQILRVGMSIASKYFSGSKGGDIPKVVKDKVTAEIIKTIVNSNKPATEGGSMSYSFLIQIFEWAAKSKYAEEVINQLIAQARKWAQDDNMEDWDDWMVDVLEIVAKFLLKKYQQS